MRGCDPYPVFLKGEWRCDLSGWKFLIPHRLGVRPHQAPIYRNRGGAPISDAVDTSRCGAGDVGNQIPFGIPISHSHK